MLQYIKSSSRATQVAILSFLIVLIYLTFPTSYIDHTRVLPNEVQGSTSNVEVGFTPQTPAKPRIPPVPSTTTLDLQKPEGIKVIGLIFYGRRSRVEILSCYLQRNLPEHGGWLDEVHFVRNTDDAEDLLYLDTLVASNPRYQLRELNLENTLDHYSASWELLERDAIYVKMDDDVVFVADDTIPRIVTRKLNHPEYLLVSANLINNPLMSKVHYDNGAYHPYLPVHESLPREIYDQFERAHLAGDTKWQFSHYPNWTGPADYTLEYDTATEGLSPVWLRMQDDQDILRTPIRNVTYDTWGPGCKSWSIAAQSHLSLLENILHENTSVYYDALNEIWFTDYDRLSINFIAVEANEILSHLPVDSDVVDEEWITVVLPKRIKKHVAIETRALAAHFSFSFQNAIQYTDVLDRYLDYANQNVCLTQDQSGMRIFGDGLGAPAAEPHLLEVVP